MRLNFSNKETVLVRVILVVALIFAAISFVQNGGLTGFVPSENRTNSLPVWTGNDSWQTGKNSAFTADLNNFFSDADSDALTYLATAADKIDVSVQDNLLTVTPALDFVGERTIVILVSDEFDVVRINVKIIVGTEEERALHPIEEPIITEPIIEENITIEEILNESSDINVSSNISQPEVLNTTVSSENVSLETEEIAVKTFDVNEKIKDENNKDVGKKLVDEIAFETFFTSIEKNESGMQVIFYHNATSIQPVWIEGDVDYALSSNVARPFENITLFVPRIEGIIPKFKLHVGITSDVFEFGKVIPDIVFDGNSTLIDRDDEKIDVLLSKGDASADIRGAYDVPAITAKVSESEEAILKTDVFAANSMPIDNATISLLKKGRVTAVMECSEFNILTDSCSGEWVKTNIPFAENETHITFTVTHFSGYAGAEIEILNIQSYPQVGGNWEVRFTTQGTANLTIEAINGTTWSNNNENEDLKFLEITCGIITQNYQWINNKVFIENYNCNETSHELSKVITSGQHHLKFAFGDAVAYANNIAAFWSRSYDLGASGDNARAVAIDSDGNSITAGYGGDSSSVFIVKHNINGTEQWNATITDAMAFDIAINSSINDIVITGAKSNDVFTAKYNAAGIQIWNATYDGLYTDSGYAVAVNDTGDIIVGGYGWNMTRPTSGITREDWLLVKYNSTGAELWNKNYSFSELGSVIYDVAFDSSNNIIATGYMNNLSNAGFNNSWLIVKFDSSGNEIWNRTIISNGASSPWGVAVDSADNIIVAGNVYNSTVPVQNEFFIIKYNSAGVHQWNKTVDTPGDGIIFDVALNSTNAITITGDSNASWLTIRYDDNGNQQWNQTGISGTPYGVAVNSRDDTLVAGTSGGNFFIVSYATRGPPNTTQVIINSSFGTNFTDENITCYVNMTDRDYVNLNAYFNWYNNSVLISSLSGNITVANGTLTNISTLDSSLTSMGETWTCEVKAWDGEFNETDWNNATINITAPRPNITQVFMNSSQGMNFTDEDLTCWVNSTDDLNTSLIVHYKWYNRSVLMPVLSGSTAVTSGVLTAVSTLDHSYTHNDTWKCEVRGWNGYLNETDFNNATAINVSICGNVTRDFTLTENHIRNTTSCLNITANNTVINCNYRLIKGNITKKSGQVDGQGGIGIRNGYNITIQNCNISGFMHGLSINMSSAITVVNSNFFNNTNGMYIDDSYGLTVTSNNMNNQTRSAILSTAMNHSIIANNTMNYNHYWGMSFDGPIYNNTFDNNTIIINDDPQTQSDGIVGFYLWRGGQNLTFTNNYIHGAPNYGIQIQHVNGALFQNNRADNNTLQGLYLWDCNYTNIFNNTFQENLYDDGIYLEECNNNNITNNTVLGGGDNGIKLTENYGVNIISGNSIRENVGMGIYGYYSSNLTVYNNSVDASENYGAFFEYCTALNISNNRVLNSIYSSTGLYVKESSANITGNIIAGNEWAGLELDNSDNAYVRNNTIQNNIKYGIYSTSSDGISIINNSIFNNSDAGIMLGSSHYGNISNNVIANNTNYGIYFTQSNSSNVSFNSISFTAGTGISINGSAWNNLFENNVWNNSLYGVLVGNEMVVAGGGACPEFTCGDSSCIDNDLTCDGNSDCPGGEDEEGYGGCGGLCGDVCSWNKVINNTLYNNSVAGIVVVNTDNETIVNNTILSCGYYGILLNDTVDSNITRNTVKDHTYSIYLDSSSRNLIYDNYFENEPLADSLSTNNNWNISKTLGTNIILGPYLGGNYWAGYNGSDTVDHDGLGDTDLPWRGTAYEITNGGDERPLLMRPDTLLVSINSSFGTNYTDENLTCWVNLTDPTNTSLVAYFNWYNNSVLYSSGSTAVALEILTNISTIDSSLTTMGENWTCEVKAWDGTDNETGWNNASLVIDNNLPNTTQVIVNSSLGTNYDTEDITCWANSTDNENTSLIAYFNWYTNAVLYSSGSTAVTANSLTNISTIDNSLTSAGENWTCEVKAWDGTDNETDWNNGSVVILALSAPPSAPTTSAGGGSKGAPQGLPGGVNRSCAESWICTPFSECIGGTKTRICTDLNNCGSEKLRPYSSVACEVPKPIEQVIVVPEIKAEVETPASNGWLFRLPELVMNNLCFVLMLATYLTLILAAVFSIIYFLTRNYFENMNKYFGISYVLIALAGLFLMANFVVCKELLTPALLAIAGIVGVFVLDTIITGVVRQGTEYWMRFKTRESVKKVDTNLERLEHLNKWLGKSWKKQFGGERIVIEKPEFEHRPKLLRNLLDRTVNDISRFNESLKNKIDRFSAQKKPEAIDVKAKLGKTFGDISRFNDVLKKNIDKFRTPERIEEPADKLRKIKASTEIGQIGREITARLDRHAVAQKQKPQEDLETIRARRKLLAEINKERARLPKSLAPAKARIAVRSSSDKISEFNEALKRRIVKLASASRDMKTAENIDYDSINRSRAEISSIGSEIDRRLKESIIPEPVKKNPETSFAHIDRFNESLKSRIARIGLKNPDASQNLDSRFEKEFQESSVEEKLKKADEIIRQAQQKNENVVRRKSIDLGKKLRREESIVKAFTAGRTARKDRDVAQQERSSRRAVDKIDRFNERLKKKLNALRK